MTAELFVILNSSSLREGQDVAKLAETKFVEESTKEMRLVCVDFPVALHAVLSFIFNQENHSFHLITSCCPFIINARYYKRRARDIIVFHSQLYLIFTCGKSRKLRKTGMFFGNKKYQNYYRLTQEADNS